MPASHFSVPLPPSWPKHANTGALYVISLAERHRLDSEVVMRREEIRIKDARTSISSTVTCRGNQTGEPESAWGPNGSSGLLLERAKRRIHHRGTQQSLVREPIQRQHEADHLGGSWSDVFAPCLAWQRSGGILDTRQIGFDGF